MQQSSSVTCCALHRRATVALQESCLQSSKSKYPVFVFAEYTPILLPILLRKHSCHVSGTVFGSMAGLVFIWYLSSLYNIGILPVSGGFKEVLGGLPIQPACSGVHGTKCITLLCTVCSVLPAPGRSSKDRCCGLDFTSMQQSSSVTCCALHRRATLLDISSTPTVTMP